MLLAAFRFIRLMTLDRESVPFVSAWNRDSAGMYRRPDQLIPSA